MSESYRGGYMSNKDSELLKLIDKVTERAVLDDFIKISKVYIDLPCLKDTRLGTVLALDKTSLPILHNGISKYNSRIEHSFTKEFEGLTVTESQCESAYKNPNYSKSIFNHSPDTEMSGHLLSIYQMISAHNFKCDVHEPITTVINIYPLTMNPLIQLYGKFLNSYFKNCSIFSFISIDPCTIPKQKWSMYDMLFLNDLAKLCNDNTPFKELLLVDQEMLSKHIFGNPTIGEDAKKKGLEQGLDYTKSEVRDSVFTMTEIYLSQYTNFLYMPFKIALPKKKK